MDTKRDLLDPTVEVSRCLGNPFSVLEANQMFLQLWLPYHDPPLLRDVPCLPVTALPGAG